MGEDPIMVFDWMPPVLAPTTVTLEDDTKDTVDMLPVPDSLVGESQILDSNNLIAEDELEDSDDHIDESVVENASAIVSWILPVSLIHSSSTLILIINHRTIYVLIQLASTV